MRTDDNKLKENENKIENEEEKSIQNKEVKTESNGKLSNLEKFTIFLGSTLAFFYGDLVLLRDCLMIIKNLLRKLQLC